MPYTLWTSRQEYDVCMKRKNKIVLTSLVSLIVGAAALYTFSLHESLSEYDDAKPIFAEYVSSVISNLFNS